MATTGGFTSSQLINEELILTLPSLDLAGALEIGEIAKSLAVLRKLPLAIQVRLGDWIIFHASITGSTSENHWWIDRKARVVSLKHLSLIHISEPTRPY